MQPVPVIPRAFVRAAFACAVLATFLVSASALAQAPSSSGIHVHGSATVYGVPDIAVLTLGVDVTAQQVGDALASADRSMRAVRQAFLDGGVEARDIRTVAFNVRRQEVRDRNGSVTGEHYQVVQTYQITLRDLSKLGELVSAAVNAGANDVQGIQFSIADPGALQAKARAAAMHDARAKAQQLADLAGVTLGRPLTIDESSSPVASPAGTMAAVRVGAGSPVQAGQLAVWAAVDVRYAIH
jgi:uncharacterized protein YggE